MKRGDIVLIAAGKPRPAVVVQANRVATPITILLCPISSYLVDAPLYRPKIEPDKANALAKTSQTWRTKSRRSIATRSVVWSARWRQTICNDWMSRWQWFLAYGERRNYDKLPPKATAASAN